MLQISTTYTVSDMAMFNRMAVKIYPNKRIGLQRALRGFIGVLGFLAGGLSLRQGVTPWVSIPCILCGFAYLLSSILHYRIMGYQTQISRPKGVESMSFTFDKLGMVAENAQGHGRFSPDDIAHITESKHLFALFVKENRQGFVIPKRALDDVDGFRTLVQTQYPCPFTKF